MLKTKLDLMKANMPGMAVRVVELCNEEEHYIPGDEGIVKFVDDAGQVHVSWSHGGSIALLPEDKYDFCMYNKDIMEKVRAHMECGETEFAFPIGRFYKNKNKPYSDEEPSHMAKEVSNYLRSHMTSKELNLSNEISVHVDDMGEYSMVSLVYHRKVEKK